VTEMKPKLLTNKTNETEQNWTTKFIHYCSVPRLSVDNCRYCI